MSCDVSSHSISPREREEWYFTPLEWVRPGQEQKPLRTAEILGYGLLEVTEVMEFNPIHSNASTTYSNPFRGDRDGLSLYRHGHEAVRSRDGGKQR